MAVAVRISGHPRVPGIEMTFTENVSSRGARVLSERRWQPNERLAIASLSGDFRTMARVVYCHALNGGEFAIGLEFLEPIGSWITNPSSIGSGNNVHA